MITQLTEFSESIMIFGCTGRGTKANYDPVLVPAVQKVLQTYEKARVHYEIDKGFTGIEHGAMSEDLKVGIEHLTRCDSIAIVTDIERIKKFMLAPAPPLHARKPWLA